MVWLKLKGKNKDYPGGRAALRVKLNPRSEGLGVDEREPVQNEFPVELLTNQLAYCCMSSGNLTLTAQTNVYPVSAKRKADDRQSHVKCGNISVASLTTRRIRSGSSAITTNSAIPCSAPIGPAPAAVSPRRPAPDVVSGSTSAGGGGRAPLRWAPPRAAAGAAPAAGRRAASDRARANGGDCRADSRGRDASHRRPPLGVLRRPC